MIRLTLRVSSGNSMLFVCPHTKRIREMHLLAKDVKLSVNNISSASVA